MDRLADRSPSSWRFRKLTTSTATPVFIPGLEEETGADERVYRKLSPQGLWTGEPWKKFGGSKKEINALVGGRGAGKSVHLCIKMYGLCCENRGLEFAMAGLNFASTQRTLEPLWFDTVDYFGARFAWLKSEKRCTLQNGSSVQFFSGENWDKWPGGTLAGFGIDEAGLQPEDAFRQASILVRDKRAQHRQINLVGTPEGFNWFYELVGKVRDDDPRIDTTYVATDRAVEAGFLPPGEAERVALIFGPRLAEQYRSGRFVNMRAGRVYYAADKLNPKQTIPVTYNPGRPLYAFFDFNNAPGVAALAHRDGDTFQFFDEIWIETDSNTRKVCEAIAARCRLHETGIVCYGDASGGQRTANSEHSNWTIVKETLDRFFPTVQIRRHDGNPSHVDRANAVNRAFEAGNVVISEHCAQLWADLNEVSWVPGKNEIDKPKSGKAALRTHLSDAIGYGIHFEMPVQRPSHAGMRAVNYE